VSFPFATGRGLRLKLTEEFMACMYGHRAIDWSSRLLLQ
jgi:hypothetical protein